MLLVKIVNVLVYLYEVYFKNSFCHSIIKTILQRRKIAQQMTNEAKI